MEFLKGKSNIDFVGKRHVAAVISVIVVTISLALFFLRGPTWGIDFTGGTEIHLKFSEATEIGEIRDALSARGLSNDAVQQIGQPQDQEFVIRIQPTEKGDKKDARKALDVIGTLGTRGGTLESRFLKMPLA